MLSMYEPKVPAPIMIPVQAFNSLQDAKKVGSKLSHLEWDWSDAVLPEDNTLYPCATCKYYLPREKFQTEDMCVDCPKKMYRIREQIGEGCTSKVYNATHRSYGHIALKVVHKKYAGYAEIETGFLKKMQAYACFPRLYDTWTDEDGCFCIAMEHIYTTLEDVIVGDSDIKLSVDDRYKIVKGLAQAINACHQEGIAHFDIKASNIGLTGDLRVKLLDFGIAENYDMIQSPAFQKSVSDGYIVKASKEHRSIEAFLGNYPLTEKADVWAFAVVAYDIFTAQNLFDVDEFYETEQADLPENLSKEVPADIEDLIRQCTRANPSERPSIEKWCA